ncbi:MAG: hypothetical protein FWB73_06600 [Treponema sp.]|nr:hypothetical protein [Treponema sp.]
MSTLRIINPNPEIQKDIELIVNAIEHGSRGAAITILKFRSNDQSF